MRVDIEQALGLYRFAGQPGTAADERRCIMLPTDWQTLPADTRRQLLQMRLGGRLPEKVRLVADSLSRSLQGAGRIGDRRVVGQPVCGPAHHANHLRLQGTYNHRPSACWNTGGRIVQPC
ncbi:MAG: hypothetical protein R3E95_10235 [Thiolinea sp.]